MNTRKTSKILIILFALALIIEVGYAFLSSNLKINGKTKINQANWDVHFENVKVAGGSVTAETAATIDSAKTTVNYVVTLAKPGDFYEFTVDEVNDGTIDAMIAAITSTPELSETQQKYLEYTVSYSDGAAIAANQLLATGQTETIKVRIEFKKDITKTDLPASAETLTLTFSVEYVQADSTAIAVSHLEPVCKRATTLHTINSVDYGSLGTAGAELAAGDALDCDVNGDGTYDAATERFYYVSDLGTNTNYAVLIYYSNVAAGVPNNTTLLAYDDANSPRTNGPVTAIAQLPTTEQWNNVSLSATTRAIKDEMGAIHKASFSYTGKAARLLTTQEVNSACGITAGSRTIGELDSCKYLMENTRYTDNTLNQYGYWLESLTSTGETGAWLVNGGNRFVGFSNYANYATYIGVRPVIEVSKFRIES